MVWSLGPPRISGFRCFSSGTDSVTLSWSLAINESSAPVDNYTLNITPSPPDPTPANVYNTKNTTIEFALVKGVTFNVEITANSCIGSSAIAHYRVGGIGIF